MIDLIAKNEVVSDVDSIGLIVFIRYDRSHGRLISCSSICDWLSFWDSIHGPNNLHKKCPLLTYRCRTTNLISNILFRSSAIVTPLSMPYQESSIELQYHNREPRMALATRYIRSFALYRKETLRCEEKNPLMPFWTAWKRMNRHDSLSKWLMSPASVVNSLRQDLFGQW